WDRSGQARRAGICEGIDVLRCTRETGSRPAIGEDDHERTRSIGCREDDDRPLHARVREARRADAAITEGRLVAARTGRADGVPERAETRADASRHLQSALQGLPRDRAGGTYAGGQDRADVRLGRYEARRLNLAVRSASAAGSE